MSAPKTDAKDGFVNVVVRVAIDLTAALWLTWSYQMLSTVFPLPDMPFRVFLAGVWSIGTIVALVRFYVKHGWGERLE